MRSMVIAALGVGLILPGCASKKYVGREVGEINQKVDNLSGEMEKTQERVRKNETRIDQVDKDAQAGITDAKGSAQQAMKRATDAERAAKGKLLYTVTLSNDKVTFPVNRAAISPEAQAMIDDAVGKFTAENRGVYFEIEGHTDATGPAEYNEKLGLDRANAVRTYLHDKQQIALNRISVISYGETRPIVDNKTKDHRAQNRRVVINVLE